MKKYELLNAIEQAVAKGIAQKDDEKWDAVVADLVSEKTVYGISMTDPDGDEFPEGCILILVKDREEWAKDRNCSGSMIGGWVKYNYGDTDEIADYLYETIEDDLGVEPHTAIEHPFVYNRF